MITYKWPTKIEQKLTNYTYLALSKIKQQIEDMSRPWKHSVLCECHGRHNKALVARVSHIMTEHEAFLLNQTFTCANYGIHVPTFVIGHEQYVGQTKNKFATGWSSSSFVCLKLLAQGCPLWIYGELEFVEMRLQIWVVGIPNVIVNPQ